MSGWLEGFAHEPGANAGYRAGRNAMEACTAHITAGRCAGDRSVLLRGYANGYIPREPGCGPGATQFAEVDAITWHACEWNRRCTGWEVEAISMGETWTQYQLDIVGGLLIPQLRERGIAVAHTPYIPHGRRIPVGAPISGFVDHGALAEHKCPEHHDGWVPWAQLEAIAGGAGAPSLREEYEVMGQVMPSAVLSDGSVLTVGVGTDRSAFAWVRYVDGQEEGDPGTKTAWLKIGGPVIGELDAVSTRDQAGRTVVLIDGLGPGSKDPKFWVPHRVIYTDDRTKKLAARFGKWRPLGGPTNRIVPWVPPLP